MSETQNVAYKSVWKDEYLKWICGFANAQGGTLNIGKDDIGNVIGVKNAKKLLEDLPNKITTVSIDELRNLVDKQILVRIGETGRGTYYELPS